MDAAEKKIILKNDNHLKNSKNHKHKDKIIKLSDFQKNHLVRMFIKLIGFRHLQFLVTDPRQNEVTGKQSTCVPAAATCILPAPVCEKFSHWAEFRHPLLEGHVCPAGVSL
jgi:hypothetical protein